MRGASLQRGGAALSERLEERREEIEQATLNRVHAVSEPSASNGPEYAEGLRAAVGAGVQYGLEGIERGEQRAPPIPDVLLAQARLAARSGVSLDTVLRRYFAGHTLLEDFMVQEAEGEGFAPAELKRLLRSQAAIVDRLLAAVAKAYTEEAARRPQSTERRKAERVERLLAGEPLEATELGYELAAHHLGLLASGPKADEAIEEITRNLDRRLLIVRREEGVVWAWLGSRRPPDPEELGRIASRELTGGLCLAIGEAGEGISGWRLTHHQARAALSVALEGKGGVLRYAEVALLASARQDEVLLASLRELYLKPLARTPDGGELLRETLRAYFAAGQSISSAAASLEVYRRTVAKRLGAVEERIGRPLEECWAELRLALQVEERSRGTSSG